MTVHGLSPVRTVMPPRTAWAGMPARTPTATGAVACAVASREHDPQRREREDRRRRRSACGSRTRRGRGSALSGVRTGVNDPGWHSGHVLQPSPLPVRRTMPPVTTMPTSPTRLASRSGRTQRRGGPRAADVPSPGEQARSGLLVGVGHGRREDTPQGYAARSGPSASPLVVPRASAHRRGSTGEVVRAGRARCGRAVRPGRPRRPAEPAWPARTTVTIAATPTGRRACRGARRARGPRGDSSCGGRANQSATRVRTMKSEAEQSGRGRPTRCASRQQVEVRRARSHLRTPGRCRASPLSAATNADAARDDGTGSRRPAQHAPPPGPHDVGDGGTAPTSGTRTTTAWITRACIGKTERCSRTRRLQAASGCSDGRPARVCGQSRLVQSSKRNRRAARTVATTPHARTTTRAERFSRPSTSADRSPSASPAEGR